MSGLRHRREEPDVLLSNDDLRLIIKSLGISSGSVEGKLDRVKGRLYEDTLVELNHLHDLIARLQSEQIRRRTAS
jgi:hypothetical protein